MKKLLNLKKIKIFLLSVLIYFNANSQALQWEKHWGSNGWDNAKSIENYNDKLIVGGEFEGTINLDPLNTISSNGGRDFFVSQYSQSGTLDWIISLGGLYLETFTDIKTDAQGNIFILGSFYGTVDFDPSPATYNLTSAQIGGNDIFFAKYTNSGQLIWAKNIGGNNQLYGNSFDIDDNGNILIAGAFMGTIDVDPGPGTYTLNNNSCFFAKYNNLGDFIWSKQFDVSSINSISFNDSGEIYVTGSYSGTIDFDPSASVQTMTAPILNDEDCFFGKYSQNGDYLWMHSIGAQGPDYGIQVETDSNNGVYVSFNSGILKYNSSGISQWAQNALSFYQKKYVISNSKIVVSDGLTLDITNGDIVNYQFTPWGLFCNDIVFTNNSYFISGGYQQSIDIDPGAGLLNINTYGQSDFCLVNFFDCSSQSQVNAEILTSSDVSCFGGSDGSASFTGSGGIPPLTYQWINGQTSQIATNLISGEYIGIVYDSNNCEDTIHAQINQPNYTAPSICLVTVDSLSQNNLIIWDKSVYTNQPIDSFIVHREVQSNIYMPLGSISASELSLFIDTFRTKYFYSPYWSLGDPNSGTFRYKLQWKDSCGNLSELSDFHNTIYMSNNNGTFSWAQPYTIENSPNQISQYLLLRDNYNTGNWQVINSVTGTQQSISDPSYANWSNTANYRISTVWNNSCTPTLVLNNSDELLKNISFNESISNSLLPTLGITNKYDDSSCFIYPNPVNDQLHLFLGQNFNELIIEICDDLGKVLIQEKINGNHTIIHLDSLQQGCYFIQVNAIGLQRKIIKL